VEYFHILLFALAVSSDGFFAGMAYGLKKIKVPLVSLLVIAMASALAVSFSMLCGRGLAAIFPPDFASRLGAVMLMLIGVCFLLSACRDRIESMDEIGEEPLFSLNIKPLGIIVNILKEPARADFDLSGEISTREAFFLGLALAMDALGAGIGVALAGFNILLTALAVGVLKFILVNCGLQLGIKIKAEGWQTFSSLIPGLIFISLGILAIM